jgi:hypothetical protein
MTISGLVDGRVHHVGPFAVDNGVPGNPDGSPAVASSAGRWSKTGIGTRRLAIAAAGAVSVLLLIGVAVGIAPTPTTNNHPRPSAVAQTAPQAPAAG